MADAKDENNVEDTKGKKKEDKDKKRPVDDPFAFIMDLLIDVIKSFVNGMKAGYLGLQDENENQNQKSQNHMKNMQTMMDSTMKMYQGMQQLQNMQTQMQRGPQAKNAPQKQQAAPAKGGQPQTGNMQMPNMNMGNMQMPNMNMGNMQMPNMNMGNMQMPNMNMGNMQMGGMMGIMMNVCMQMMQTMMSGMMQMQQMYQGQMMQQVQNPQMQEQQPEKQAEQAEKQQEQPSKEQAEKQQEEPSKEQAEKQQEQPSKEQAEKQQEQPTNEQPEKQAGAEKQENSPSDSEIAEELINSTNQLKEANEEYKQVKAENDAVKAEIESEVLQTEDMIGYHQLDMDQKIKEISKLKSEKDTALEDDQAELNREIEEEAVASKNASINKGMLINDNINPDASPFKEKDMAEAETSIVRLSDKLKAEGADKSVLDAVEKYNKEVVDFNNKDVDKLTNAEDTVRTYDAAKNFLDATKPKLINEGARKGQYETLSPEMMKARTGAQKLLNSVDHFQETEMRKRAEARADARNNNRQFTATNNLEMKWFSKNEIDKAISSLDNMRDANGKLGPGAEKFHGALSELKNTMGKKNGGINADAYVNVYNAADGFMKESLSSKMKGPAVDAARQAGKDVRKRLNENNRIDKLNVVADYEKRMQLLTEKTGKINERRQAQEQREKKIQDLRTEMRAARGKRNAANTERHQENKRRLDESNKKLEAAKQKRDAAKNRRLQAEQSKRRSRQTQMKAPQKNAMGM